jgi:serine/threonine-protein kinase PpkA
MNRDPSNPSPHSGQNPALPDVHGFRLQRVLGYGGMSTVYLARQRSLDREVALKVMLPEALTDEVSRRRFENEARTIARLDHPNIVGIYEVGRTKDGLPYYAMPYLPRGHLGARRVSDNPPNLRDTLNALLSALEYAHARGVVHRDVKAENVLFDEGERPLLADFGIALRRGYGTRVTTAGLAVGSTAYMPPEQARGHNVDGRADLYSVGVLGWELLTGALPYNAGDALSMALQHAQEPIPRLPPEYRHWQKFFDKALAKTPEARFATARDMRDALERVPERNVARASDPEHAARVRKGLAWGAVALVVLAAGAFFWRWQSAVREAPLPVAGTVASTLPAPDATTGTSAVGAGDSLDTFMRPLPESPGERWIVAAERQIAQQRWASPQGDNAYESLMTAVQADDAHPRLVATAETLVAALGEQAARAIASRDPATAKPPVDKARALAQRIALPTRDGATTPAAIAQLETGLDKALQARIREAARKGDGDGAVKTLAAARTLGLPTARLRALETSAKAAAAADTRNAALESGWTLLRNARGTTVIADTPVSRAEYARFAEATGRASARCRERGSPLRVIAPRDWKSPGFQQTEQQPVVCVSWQDAQAYAQWRGARDGRRYRLARAEEVSAAPSGGARPVAVWSDACGASCTERVTAGKRGRGSSERALQGDRGYADVGIRLARSL